MKRKAFFIALVTGSALNLAACSQEQGERQETVSTSPSAVSDYAMTEAASEATADTASAAVEIPVSLPQLAYQFDYAFALPGADLRRLQRQHASLCEQQGPASCQIVGMSASGQDDELSGELQLLVATREARAFGALLEDEAETLGAETTTANLATEEVSKQLVDTEARLQSRIELRDRLREVLRTRQGTVEELIEAESGVAAVDEEIDQARAWLAETRGRVAMSRMNVRYESAGPIGSSFTAPVSAALGSLGGILGYLAAMMIIAGAVLLPIGGIVWAVRRLLRRPDPVQNP